MPKIVIGVMGPGEGATNDILKQAHTLGRLIARQGWTLLTGGRNVGVMDAASKGAKQAGGLTIGILPSSDKTDASVYLDIAICTGMGKVVPAIVLMCLARMLSLPAEVVREPHQKLCWLLKPKNHFCY